MEGHWECRRGQQWSTSEETAPEMIETVERARCICTFRLCPGEWHPQRVTSDAESPPGSRVLEMGLGSQESYHTIQVFQGTMFSAEGYVAMPNQAGKRYS